MRRTKAWPKTPQHLSNRLKRLAPPLRSVGLEYTPDAGRKGPKEPRRKRLRWTDGPPERGRTPSSTPSTSSTPVPEPRRDAPPDTDVTAGMDDGEDGVDGAVAGMDDAGAGALGVCKGGYPVNSRLDRNPMDAYESASAAHPYTPIPGGWS